ncbi:MAG: Dna2/Cas4 domain-containing protein [Clostridiales bacterium]|jgi:CRISPR-associated exonuclease Cas4|nr:Dna2/Cas4 domain-containing protein [Clostridiales bacterium]
MRGIRQVKLKDAPFLCRQIYADGQGGRLLHSEKHNLRGKPDFIFKNIITGRLVPMELKSGEVESTPHHGDIMQLAAYFLIVEDTMGARPKVGYLRYKNAMFKVKNTSRLRRALLDIVADMRRMLITGEGEANPSFARCRYCAARGTVCEFTDP